MLVNPDDLAALGLADGETVDLVSEWRRARSAAPSASAIVAYPTARGCAAAYFPETNALVPLDSTADVSNTPTSKSVVIRLEPVELVAGQRRRRPAGDAARARRADADAVGAGQVAQPALEAERAPTAPGRCRARRRGPPGRASRRHDEPATRVVDLELGFDPAVRAFSLSSERALPPQRAGGADLIVVCRGGRSRPRARPARPASDAMINSVGRTTSSLARGGRRRNGTSVAVIGRAAR